MIKKILVLLALSLSSYVYADTCPTPVDLKMHHFHGWSVYNIDDGSPLTAKQLAEFTLNAASFALAELYLDAPVEGSAHCFYYHRNPKENYGIAYLAKPNLVNANEIFWEALSSSSKRCTNSIEACAFAPAKML